MDPKETVMEFSVSLFIANIIAQDHQWIGQGSFCRRNPSVEGKNSLKPHIVKGTEAGT